MVRDGLSTTALAFEKRQVLSHLETGTRDAGNDLGWVAGLSPSTGGADTLRTLVTGWGPNSINTPDLSDFPDFHKDAGSSHPSGVNTLFGDGRVGGLSSDTDLIIRRRLSTRSGGERIDPAAIPMFGNS